MRTRLSFFSPAELGGANRVSDLERLARRVFGEGDRPAAWFAQKLRRECVDMDMSVIAVENAEYRDDPESWLGYALLGVPPSLGAVARAAGVGLLPDARGRGRGADLVSHALASAHRRGRAAVRLLAQPQLVPYYEKLGFTVRRGWETWRGTGEGASNQDLPAPGPWTIPGVQLQLSGWLAEAWSGTTNERRATLWYDLDGLEMVAHVSREGRAFLVQRLCVEHPDQSEAALQEIVFGLPGGAPVLITGVDPASAITDSLRQAGFDLAQRGFVMQKAAG